jgi:CRP/FNR family transcriptional regulator
MMRLTSVWYVKTGPVLNELTEDVLAPFSHVDIVRKQHYLYFPEEATEYVYLIRAGKIRLLQLEGVEENTVAFLTGGDLFGELRHEDRAASDALEVVEDTVIRTAERRAFEEVIMTPAVRALTARLVGETDPLEIHVPLGEVLETTPRQRLAGVILKLMAAAGIPRLDGNVEIPLKITSDTLIRLTGLSDRDVSEALGQFLSDHIIEIVGRHLIVRNRKELSKASARSTAPA